MSNENETLAISASISPSDALAEQVIQDLELDSDVKKNWDEATAIRKKTLNRSSESYSEFRRRLKNKLILLIASERNGWVKMEDGKPSVGRHYNLWLNDGTFVLQAELKNTKYKVMNVVIDNSEIEISKIDLWKAITYPGEFGRGGEILKGKTSISNELKSEDVKSF